MPHTAREIVEREIGQLNWSHQWTREGLMEHFRMAPTVRQVLADYLPDRSFRSPAEVIQAIPEEGWERIEEVYKAGAADTRFLEALAAAFQRQGDTPS